MYGIRQTLHTGLTSSELQELLDDHARVVFLKMDAGLWDAVLEKIEDADVPPESIVVDFLGHVDATLLEKKMLEGADMGTGVGVSALKALMDMAVPGGS